jgi:type I restriction enzyme M protein
MLSAEIFGRLEGFPLVDRYAVYQLLNDGWSDIAIDLEVLQTEGFGASKKVDPRMVEKKGEEVQDGWQGRVIPFELVEKTLLKDLHDHLKKMENRLTEISASYEEILESFSDEEKESDAVNEAKDAFVNSWITKESKKLLAEKKRGALIDEDSFEAKILLIDKLITEERSLKAKLKKESIVLHNKTKDTIENLTDEESRRLLEAKWIDPLLLSINSIPKTIIDELITKIDALSEKYKTTFSEIENELHETEISLSNMIRDLTGSPHDLKGLEEFCSLLGVE